MKKSDKDICRARENLERRRVCFVKAQDNMEKAQKRMDSFTLKYPNLTLDLDFKALAGDKIKEKKNKLELEMMRKRAELDIAQEHKEKAYKRLGVLREQAKIFSQMLYDKKVCLWWFLSDFMEH